MKNISNKKLLNMLLSGKKLTNIRSNSDCLGSNTKYDSTMLIRERIYQLRKAHKITLKEIGIMTGYGLNHIVSVEEGIIDIPNIEYVWRIARIFGLTMKEMVGFSVHHLEQLK